MNEKENEMLINGFLFRVFVLCDSISRRFEILNITHESPMIQIMMIIDVIIEKNESVRSVPQRHKTSTKSHP